MPFAKVMFNKDKVGEAGLRKLGELLPGIIAKHLSVPGIPAALVAPGDVEVEFSSFGPFDIHHKDIQIIIWADQYPERAINLDARCKAINCELYSSMWSWSAGMGRSVNYFVWILLQQGSFVEYHLMIHQS